jgi:hypothetical protein
MNDGTLSGILFDVGLVAALTAMILGSLEIDNWAITAGVIACCFALASIALGLQYWNEQEREDGATPPEAGNPNTAEPVSK